MRVCEKYIAGLYGSYENVAEARYRLHASRDIVKESQLPPSINAVNYHIRRAAYQIYLWKQSLIPNINAPSPTDNGWDSALAPIMCYPSPAHDDIMISCKCKKSGCESKGCKCFKAGIRCTDACGCLNCLNMGIDSSSEE